MKRSVWFVLLLALGTFLGGILYAAIRPEPTDDERKLRWLAAQLELTPGQLAKIRVLHEQHCPEICRLSTAADAGQQCRNATKELIGAVSAELTPAQRQRYLELVASCLEESGGAAARP